MLSAAAAPRTIFPKGDCSLKQSEVTALQLCHYVNYAGIDLYSEVAHKFQSN